MYGHPLGLRVMDKHVNAKWEKTVFLHFVLFDEHSDWNVCICVLSVTVFEGTLGSN